MATFNLKSVLRGYQRLFGMTAEIYNESGDLLDSVDLNNSRKKVSFRFDKDQALQGADSADLSIKLIDNNGDEVNLTRNGGGQYDLDADQQTFTTTISARKRRGRAKLDPSVLELDNAAPLFTSGAAGSVDENVDPGTLVYDAETTDASSVSYALNGGDSAAFSIDPQTGQVSINQSPDFESKSSYSFNVVATDARGNASSQAVTVSVNDIEEGQTVQLTPLLDTITAADLSNQNDVITAGLGNLGNGFLDSVVDGSTQDNDQLTINTNATFDLDQTLDSDQINRIQNIETLQIVANNDDVGGGQTINLDKVVNLKTLDIDGTFTDKLTLSNWANTGATTFDYSGITSTEGVVATLANAGDQTFAANLNIKGSAGDDVLNALNGDTTMSGGAGNDVLFGSRAGQSTIAGGSGTDAIFLWTQNAQHTVQLHGQTSETSKDTIVLNSFQGFNNANARSLNTFDLIEIDAATFTNYSAGQPVQQQTLAAANISATDLSNTVVTSTSQAALELADFDNKGNGILGFAADTGTLLYSASGDFSADAQELFSIGATEGANFVPTRQINVI